MQRFALIIDKVIRIELDMLLNITKQLTKGKSFIDKSIIIFVKLPIVILIKDFY